MWPRSPLRRETTGYGAIICGAGMAAHLAGAVAGADNPAGHRSPSLGRRHRRDRFPVSTVQMPRGIPVATVAIDGAANAALLAVEMFAVTDVDLQKRLADYRAEWLKSTRRSL